MINKQKEQSAFKPVALFLFKKNNLFYVMDGLYKP